MADKDLEIGMRPSSNIRSNLRIELPESPLVSRYLDMDDNNKSRDFFNQYSVFLPMQDSMTARKMMDFSKAALTGGRVDVESTNERTGTTVNIGQNTPGMLARVKGAPRGNATVEVDQRIGRRGSIGTTFDLDRGETTNIRGRYRLGKNTDISGTVDPTSGQKPMIKFSFRKDLA
tara:strand:+ start:235 stop:759 length:525 start_codon:yes stop_codon:yes gene_type:complete